MEPFFSTRQPWEAEILGLAVCCGIISQNGGCIEVESQEGQGAALRVCLPRTAPPD